MATQRSITPPGFYDPQPPTKNGRLPAQIRKIELPQLSDHPIFIALFENVTNAAFLRQQLLAGNPEFDYCFIDARMVSLSTSSHPSNPIFLPHPPSPSTVNTITTNPQILDPVSKASLPGQFSGNQCI